MAKNGAQLISRNSGKWRNRT